MGSVSTSIRGVRFTPYIPGGNEWVRFPRHSVSGSTLLGLTWDSWCGKGTAPGCAWCLRGAMLLRGFRLFGVALHREPKGTKRNDVCFLISPQEVTPRCYRQIGRSGGTHKRKQQGIKFLLSAQRSEDGKHKCLISVGNRRPDLTISSFLFVLVCLSADWTGAPGPVALTRATKTLVVIVLVCLSADWTGSSVPSIITVFPSHRPLPLLLYLCVCAQTGQVHSYLCDLTCTTKTLNFIVLVCLSADWAGSPVPFIILYILFPRATQRLCMSLLLIKNILPLLGFIKLIVPFVVVSTCATLHLPLAGPMVGLCSPDLVSSSTVGPFPLPALWVLQQCLSPPLICLNSNGQEPR